MKINYLTGIAAIVMAFSSYGQVAQNATPTVGTATQQLNSANPNSPGYNLNGSTIQSTQLHLQEDQQFGPVPAGQHVCKTDELNQQHYAERGILNEFNQDYLQSANAISTAPPVKTSGTNEIAVIFHVVYNPNTPAENVSNALIMQVYNDVVEDYQLLNANASNARTGAPYNFTPADANINFCLATQTPTGTPLAEVGVVRVSTTEAWYDSDNGEENKMKSSATGGSDIWDRNEYLNIWICDISNGAGSGTAGYAYRPTPSFLPSSNIDGIVLDYNLGMNNENVLTHEIGHYLGLDHTWGGSGGCTNDDGFGDTPNTAGPSFNYSGSCSGSQQTCSGIETQYENYMDYANCTVMFTQNQADYMLSILTGIRSSLLLSPGCDPVNAPPVVDFVADIADPIIIPVGGTVNFFSIATNAPTSWTWSFGGGAAGQTVENPNVTFNTLGTYDVTHTATNAYGTGTETKTAHVQVVAPATGNGCDTLRNYNQADPFYTLTAGGGYVQGNSQLTTNCLEWAEPYIAASTIEVKAVEFAPTRVNDAGGSVTFKVYQDNAGSPGTVVASETVALANLTELQWNNVEFTTPYTATGQFWVGYEVSYAATDTFALLTTYNAAPATNYTWVNRVTTGWEAVGPIFTGSPAVAFVMDVLTSNGTPPSMSFTATDNEVCEGGSITLNGSASTNNNDYRWYVTDVGWTTTIDTSTASGTTFSFPTAGNYEIYLFGSGSCATDGVYMPVTVDPAVTATITPTHTSCGNNNGIITASAPSGGDGTYYYSLDGINYQVSPIFSNLASGTYDVYVATLGDNCETMYSVTINPSSAFVAGVSQNASVCPGGSATITASGGTTYNWMDGTNSISNSASTTVSPAATNQYNCIVTNSAGCQSTVSTTITVNTPAAAPTISASGPTTICAGSSVDLTSSYPTNNSWSTTETSSTITVSTSGSYSVTYTDGNGCTSTSGLTTVTVNAAPSIASGTVSDPTTCATATGSIQVTGSGTGDVSWTGTQSGNATGVTLPYTISSLAAGSYNITFTDGIGCVSNLVSEALNDPTPPATPTISAGSATTFCDGGSVVLTSSSLTGNSWSTTESTGSITVTTSGSYSVTVTDGSGCSATSAPTVITVNSNPAAPTITPTGATTFCDGGSVNLSSSQGSGNSWNTTESTQTITATTGGSYTVTYTNANGCSTASAPIVVTVNANPSAPTITPSGATTFCDGGSVTLTSSELTGNDWSTTEVTGSINVTTTGSYTVTYTDANGCFATSAATSVTVNPNPATPVITPNGPTSICDGDMVTLSSSYASGNVWNTTENTASIDVSTSGSYSVTHTDVNGCTAVSAPLSIVVNALPSVTFGALADLCDYNSAITLTQGTPAGGVYSGTGVSGTSFDPATAGLGTHTLTYDYTDANGCSASATSDIIVDGCLAIEDIQTSELNIFPNPTNHELNIQLLGDFNYEIIDSRGRLVNAGNGNNTVTINTSNYESGIYLVQIKSNQISSTVRVVKN